MIAAMGLFPACCFQCPARRGGFDPPLGTAVGLWLRLNDAKDPLVFKVRDLDPGIPSVAVAGCRLAWP